MPGAVYNSKRLRMFAVLDNFTHECLSTPVNVSTQGDLVVNVLDRISAGQVT